MGFIQSKYYKFFKVYNRNVTALLIFVPIPSIVGVLMYNVTDIFSVTKINNEQLKTIVYFIQNTGKNLNVNIGVHQSKSHQQNSSMLFFRYVCWIAEFAKPHCGSPRSDTLLGVVRKQRNTFSLASNGNDHDTGSAFVDS